MPKFKSALACALAIFATGSAAQDIKLGSPNFDRMPAGTFAQMFDGTKSTGFPGLAWTGAPGQMRTVTVAFNGGLPVAWTLIEKTANEWTERGGRLRFSFHRPNGAWRTWDPNAPSGAQPKPDIRIGFFTDPVKGGYWSVLGTLAQRVNRKEATMNFDDLGTLLAAYDPAVRPQQWQDSYAHSVILHEFGHALGLNHEHFHPSCQRDLKLPEAIASLTQPPNDWPVDQARFNIDASYYLQQMAASGGGQAPTVSPASDRASVMLYSFQDAFYRSGVDSPCRPLGALRYATSLSAQDRVYYASVYGSHP